MIILARCVMIGANGVVLMYPSEFLFWSVFPADQSVASLTMTLIAYSLAGWMFLLALEWAPARSIGGLFAIGSLFGWIVEGVVEGTMYLDFPINLLWTGAAWHGLISVCAIWWAVRRLQAGRLARSAPALLALGAGFGFWAAFWPNERPDFPGAETLAAQGVVAALLVGTAFVAIDRLPPAAFRARRGERMAALVLVAVLFGLRAASAPTPLLIAFPVLTIGALWLARRLAALGEAPPVLDRWADLRAPPWRRLELLLVPTGATAVYAALGASEAPIHSNVLVAVATIAAALAWIVALIVRALLSPGRAAEPGPLR